MIERAGEKEDLEKVLMSEYSDDPNDFMNEAKRFIKKYVPQKAIDRYLSPTKVYTEHDYWTVLYVMIRNYKVMKMLRQRIQIEEDMGKEHADYTLEELRKGEEIGF